MYLIESDIENPKFNRIKEKLKSSKNQGTIKSALIWIVEKSKSGSRSSLLTIILSNENECMVLCF